MTGVHSFVIENTKSMLALNWLRHSVNSHGIVFPLDAAQTAAWPTCVSSSSAAAERLEILVMQIMWAQMTQWKFVYVNCSDCRLTASETIDVSNVCAHWLTARQPWRWYILVSAGVSCDDAQQSSKTRYVTLQQAIRRLIKCPGTTAMYQTAAFKSWTWTWYRWHWRRKSDRNTKALSVLSNTHTYTHTTLVAVLTLLLWPSPFETMIALAIVLFRFVCAHDC